MFDLCIVSACILLVHFVLFYLLHFLLICVSALFHGLWSMGQSIKGFFKGNVGMLAYCGSLI